MSLKLKSISVRNFLGFGNKTETVDLSTLGTTMLVGENVDKGGANGVGKTSIANAISYALYNVPLEKISKERLINTTNNSKNTSMEVVLDFEVDGIEYQIKRSRGAHTETRLLIAGEDKTPDSIDNTNKLLEEIVGVSFELFRRTVVFLGGDQPFFEMSVSQQRGLIEELFKITMLSEKADLLKKQNSVVEKDIEVQTAVIKAQEKARDLHVKQLGDAAARTAKWENDKAASIESVKAQITKSATVDFDAEEEALTTIETLDKQVIALRQRYNTARASINSWAVRFGKVENELGHLRDAKCPYCLQKFEDSQKKIEGLENESKNLSEKMELGVVESDADALVISTVEAKIDNLKSSVTHSSIRALLVDKQEVATLASKLSHLENSANPHVDAYESLLNDPDVVVDYSKLDELKSDLEHRKFLLKLLVDKNSFIRKKIISKSIPFLNKRLYEHSRSLGLPHLVSFNPDMSCTISEYGRELDYGNLSGGQKKRLNLALSLAFRDMLQHLHTSIGLLIVDEVDGGAMDVIGVESIIKVLKDLANTEQVGIWIISHRPECVGRFDREMLIKFENGFSTISEVTIM